MSVTSTSNKIDDPKIQPHRHCANSIMTQLYLGLFTREDVYCLSSTLDFDDIVRHPQLPWCRNKLSLNPTMRLHHWNIVKDWGVEEALQSNGLRKVRDETTEDDTPFAHIYGEWAYDLMVANFGREGRREVFPISQVKLVTTAWTYPFNRSAMLPTSVEQMDWYDSTYRDRLVGRWNFSVVTTLMDSIGDLEELHRRGNITASECCKAMSSRRDVTLEIMERIKGGTKGWHYWSLSSYLPLEELPRLRELHREHKIKETVLMSRDGVTEAGTWAMCRRDVTKERFEVEFANHNASRKFMLECVLAAINFDYLVQWPDAETSEWSRTYASYNKDLPISWLIEVFDKWPQVYGVFAMTSLIDRASITEYMLYLRNRTGNPDIDDYGLRTVLAQSKRRELLLAFLDLSRHNITFCPKVTDLTTVSEIKLDDFYFFYPKSRPLPTPYRFDRLNRDDRFSDLVILTV
jgi:hypothetical protein